MTARHRAAGALAAALLLVAACGGGDDADSATSSPSTTAETDETDGTAAIATGEPEADAAPSTAAIELAAGPFALEVDVDAIWAATADRSVCSPVEPSSAAVRLAPRTGGDLVTPIVAALLWWETPGGSFGRQVLVADDDGGWTGTFGPTRATRSMSDTVVPVTAVGFDADALDALGLDPAAIDAIVRLAGSVRSGSGLPAAARDALDALTGVLDVERAADLAAAADAATVAAATELTVLAPEPCGAGQERDRRGRSRTNPDLTVELDGDAVGATLWATREGTCAAGPTEVDVEATTTGRATAVRAVLTLPTGAALATTFRRIDGDGDAATWRATIGPLDAPAAMPTEVEVPVVVTARDRDDNEAVTSTVLVVRRPAVCDDAGAGDGELAFTVAATELWATRDGFCIDGGSTVGVGARTPSAVNAVGARLVRSDGSVVADVDLTRAADGVWAGTLGPVTAPPSMPASTPLTVQFRATGPGVTLTDDAALTLRRPIACPPGVTAPPPAAEAPTVSASASGTELWATFAGRCTNGPTTLTVDARTTGAADEVRVRALLPNGSSVASADLTSDGTGRWRGTIGPVTAPANAPETTSLTLEVGARSATGAATATVTVTLRRPIACPDTPTTTTAPTTTAPTTTVAATTTTAAPTTVPIGIEGAVNGAEISASANGACPVLPTTLTVGARTTGAVTEVQVRVVLSNGSVVQTVTLSANGAGQWSGSIGPIAGSIGMPETSALTVQFGARGDGPNATDSRTVTLVRPPACP